MFQINSYLQYRNTADGKPRVLVEGVDYDIIQKPYLKITPTLAKSIQDNPTSIQVIQKVANLSDCRPLLSVDLKAYLPDIKRMDKIQYTEGDVLVGTPSQRRPFTPFKGIVYFDQYFELAIDNQVHNKIFPLATFGEDIPEIQNLGSFFDDPAKYSQLLWDCSEEEGWKKVLKLLNIN